MNDYAEHRAYTVVEILDQRPSASAPGVVDFRVRWRDYGPFHDTWQPILAFLPWINTPLWSMSSTTRQSSRSLTWKLLALSLGISLKHPVSAVLQRPEPQPMIARDPNNPSLILNSPKDVAEAFAHTLQHLGGDPDYHGPRSFVSKVLAHTPGCPTAARDTPVSHIA